MKARKVSSRIQATPEELEALLALLEKERDRLIESGESESVRGRALWSATDGISRTLEELAQRKSSRVDLARLNAKRRLR